LGIEEGKNIAGKSGMYFILFRRMERERKGCKFESRDCIGIEEGEFNWD
jgi:hypothetical protein